MLECDILFAEPLADIDNKTVTIMRTTLSMLATVMTCAVRISETRRHSRKVAADVVVCPCHSARLLMR